MMKKSNFWKLPLASVFVPPLAALLGVAMVAISCGHPNATGQSSACKGSPGDEFCACLAGSTCNSGYMCATDKNQCVLVAGGGGTTGSGSGGATGTAGTSGAAGTTGTTGLGGTTGSGGTTGTAGTTGITGIAGANGTAGTNGAAGTNGGSGTNLVINGDFSNGMTDWTIPNGTPTNPGVTNGQFCLTLVTNGEVIVGWGSTSTFFAVNSGTNYTLSYQANSTGALSKFEAHVGQVGAPYTVDYNTNNNDTPSTGLTTFTHTFTVNTSDPQAGLAFDMEATTGTPTVCLDNASLTAN
jgi:hypothetical protein